MQGPRHLKHYNNNKPVIDPSLLGTRRRTDRQHTSHHLLYKILDRQTADKIEKLRLRQSGPEFICLDGSATVAELVARLATDRGRLGSAPAELRQKGVSSLTSAVQYRQLFG